MYHLLISYFNKFYSNPPLICISSSKIVRLCLVSCSIKTIAPPKYYIGNWVRYKRDHRMQICIPDSASADVFLVLVCKCPSIWVFREFVILNLSVRFRVLHHAFLVITASKTNSVNWKRVDAFPGHVIIDKVRSLMTAITQGLSRQLTDTKKKKRARG